MNDTERIIGELKEFKRVTIWELKEIKADVRGLKEWKMRVAGGAIVASLFMTSIVEGLHLYFGK